MAEKKKEYLIGDVSRIVGMSRDALRFYEKKGVIRSRKKENGYRYFSEDDIYRLMCIVYRRKMNDSLEEIRDFVKEDKSIANMREHLKKRVGEEEEQIRLRRQTIARLKLTMADVDSIEQCMGRFMLKDFPQAYVLDTCQDLYDGLRRWFFMSSEVSGLDMTYFYNQFSFRDGQLENMGTKLLVYKGLEPFISKRFQLSDCPCTEPVSCIYTIEASEKLFPEGSVVQRMEEWGRSRGLVPEGSVYSNNMTSFLGEETNTYFLELYMPVVQTEERE